MSAILDGLKHLDDPARYTRRVGVPVFTPHTKLVGGVERTVTAADLPAWAAEMAALERANGVAGVIRCGHIRPDLPEDQQPKTVGAYKRPRVGPHPLTGLPALLVDEYVLNEYAGRAKDWPHRSVEFYRDRKRITAVAWLARDPHLSDLGVNLYAAGDRPEYYSEAAMDDDTKPGEPATVDAKPADDPAAMIGQLVPLLQQVLAALQGAGGAAPPAGGVTPPPPAGYEKDVPPELYAEMAVLKDKARLNEEQVRQLRDKLADADTRAVLRTLEGYSLDVQAEYQTLVKLDEAGRRKRADYVRTHHAKLPPDGLIEVYDGPAEGGGRQRTTLTAAEMQKAVDYAAEHGLKFAAVRQQVLDGKLTL